MPRPDAHAELYAACAASGLYSQGRRFLAAFRGQADPGGGPGPDLTHDPPGPGGISEKGQKGKRRAKGQKGTPPPVKCLLGPASFAYELAMLYACAAKAIGLSRGLRMLGQEYANVCKS